MIKNKKLKLAYEYAKQRKKEIKQRKKIWKDCF